MTKMKPKLTVLNYSGGVQSTALLWMVLRGDIPRPDSFIVMNADPGMEHPETYTHVKRMFDRCQDAGIEAVTAPGPDLYLDIVELAEGATRVDNPALWVQHDDGRIGQLRQKCTKHYKIAPMDREIRRILHREFGVSRQSKRLGEDIVEKWIGFAADESHRVTRSGRKYIRFRFPLIEMEMNKQDIRAYFHEIGEDIPPRSVCNGCWANGLDTFRDLYENHPVGWRQAVAFDEAVRNLSQVGIELPAYVSRTMIPLRDLPDHWDSEDKEEAWLEANSCDSGYCFT